MAGQEGLNLKITTDATAAIAGIQKFISEMKTVGTKVDAEFDAMRQHLQKTYASIAQSGTASANEIRRAQEATAAKISTLNKQQYGEQTSLLSTLKANWIAASAAIYAAWAVLSKVWGFAEMAATFEEVEAGLQGLSAKYGMTADSAIQMAKSAVNGQLSMIEAGKLAAKAFALGFNPDQVKEFLTESEKLSHVMGGTIPEAFDSMERAAATGRKGGLVGLGIVVDLKKAVADYADNLGISVGSISANLQMQIRANAIAEAAKKVTDQLGEAHESTGVKMQKMRATLADVELIMGQLAIRGGALLVGALYGIGSAGMTVYAGMMRVAQGFYGILSMIPKFGDAYKGLYAESKAAADGAWAKTKEYSDKSTELVQAAFASKTVIARATRKQQNDETEHFKASKSAEKAARDIEKAELKSAMDVAKNTYETAASVAKEKYEEIASSAKAAYEETASAADFASRKEILLGRDVLASELETIKKKQDARATELQTELAARKTESQTDLDARKTELQTEINAINKSKELEAIKNAQIVDLKSKYILDIQKLQTGAAKDELKIQTGAAKDEQKLAQDNALKLIEIQQTTLSGGLKKGFDDIAKDYSNVGKGMTEVTKTAFSDMTNSLVDFVKTGKLNFESLVDNIITGLIKLMVQEQLAGLAKSVGSIFSLVSGTTGGMIFSAQGNIFDSGNLIPFARGGIVNQPTIFPMARGAGLMGEAGPEAVMPLTRLAGGDLGVRAVGGGGGEVTVIINNNAGAQVTQTQKETPRGLEIDVMIDQLVAKKLSQRGSSSNRTIRSNFNARETLIAR